MSREKLEQGLKFHQVGDFDAAESIYREVLADEANDPDAQHFLGLIAQQKGDLAGAVALIEAAILIAPERPTFHFNLAVIYREMGNLSKAAREYEEAAILKPDWLDAQLGWGTVLGQLGQYAAAERPLRAVLAIEPNRSEALIGLTASLVGQGQYRDAENVGRTAITVAPKSPEAWVNLGNALNSQAFTPGKLREAEDAFRQAIAIAPKYATALYNLGNVLNDQWRSEEALDYFKEAIECEPTQISAWQNYLLNLLYQPGESEESLYRAHSAWAKHIPTVDRDVVLHNQPMSDRRLKIGYVSADFKTHSCAYFLKPLFAAHDRKVVEIFAYSNVARPDDLTDWFKKNVDQWRDVLVMDDSALAAKIAEDEIDVLVDLSGHTANNRLGVFALKPAPVQVSWLGYPATTGLTQMDFRLTDKIADPAENETADNYHSERLIRLEGGFHCYQAPEDIPAVGPLPATENGFVTFGSFNHITKITPEVIETWADILLKAPSSKLLLKGGTLGYTDVCESVLKRFEQCDILTDRVELRSWIARGAITSGHPMALYNSIDIGLDTFPYNGTTTSFEAMTMGVPIITLKGDRHAARVGASIMTHAGYPEWVADSRSAYVEIAQAMAENLLALQEIRQGLRSRLQKSSLGDADLFARKLEDVFQEIYTQQLSL